MRALLVGLTLFLAAGYYAVVALAPAWLAGRVAGLPLSLLAGVAVFAAGAALCWLAPADDD